MRTPATVLAEILRSDPARPRVTFYEDTPGPTQGERIELSGKVLANWISKAGNALQDEFDLGPGSIVRLALPPHWRAIYWAFAVWSIGGTVDLAGVDLGGRDLGGRDLGGRDLGGRDLGGRAADLLVCDDPDLAATLDPRPNDVVLVTLAALARVHPGTVPSGVMDEARELATYGDQFAANADPEPGDLALISARGHTAYNSVVPQQNWPTGSRVSLSGDTATILESTLAAWAVDGSVVLARNGQQAEGEGEGEGHPDRLASEGVTLHLG